MQEVRGTLNYRAGQLSDDPDLRDEGTVDKIGGKVRQVVGKIEQAAGS